MTYVNSPLKTFLSQELISKSCSALSAAALEDFSAVSGLHSLSEAVFFLSLAFLRLICSEHFGTSFVISGIIIYRCPDYSTDIINHSALYTGKRIYYRTKGVFCQ